MDYDKLLIDSVSRENLKGVLSALDGGADVNTKDKYGWTALSYVVKYGPVEIARALLQAGADVNAKNQYGWTVLMSAARDGNREMVDVILQSGADWDIKNRRGKTALDLSLEKGHNDITALIKSCIERQAEQENQYAFDLNI